MHKEFSAWLKERGKKSASRAYYFAIRNFLKFLDESGIDLFKLSSENMLSFLNGFDNPYTRNLHQAACVTFFKYMKTKSKTPDEMFYWDKMIAEVKAIKYAPAKKRVAEIEKGKLRLRKISLSEEGVKQLFEVLINRCKKKEGEPTYEAHLATYVGTVLTFYFGWRPIEATERFIDAVKQGAVDTNNRIMVIKGAKTMSDRILVWDKSLDYFIKMWLYFARKRRKNKRPFLYPTIITRNLSGVVVEGVNVTAKTGRETVITLLRKRFMKEVGLDERYIPADIRQKLIEWWVGHTTTPIQDIYTDEAEFLSDLRVLACKTHFVPEILSKINNIVL